MKNQNFILTFQKTSLSLQIITLTDSFFIYLSGGPMTFDNLTLAIFSNPSEISTIQLIDDSPNQISTTLANSLSSKLKVPIYLSLNLSDEQILCNPLLFSFLENEIFKLLKK